MITKASELLELFIKEESSKLEGYDMPHMPTLGSAYEEVTKHGINQSFSIPKHCDLKVVSGFISIDGEMLPEQIDCMLVHGDGEKYGLTDQYIYEIETVLCIFEVKKTLRKADFLDAFDHLGKIRRKFSEYFEKKLKQGNFEPNITAARKHFSQLTGRIAPDRYIDIHLLSKSDAMLFYTLVQESLAPISIIHGYDGYKTENGLRTAFLDILEEKSQDGGQGYGVPSIPSLVTSNQFCLIKGNGIPFLAIRDKNSWVTVFSTRHNSAKIILELIWSKISIYFNVMMPWNDGLDMDNIQPLLVAEATETDEASGWTYISMECKEKHLERDDNGSWHPESIGTAEVSVINIMAMRGGYLPLDQGMQKYLSSEHDVTLKEVVDNLILSREFMLDGDNIRPINSCTHIITNDDGTGFVSSERERFDVWCSENSINPYYLNIHFIE